MTYGTNLSQGYAGDNKRTINDRLAAQLENEAASFISHWRDLGDYIMPRRPRFYTSDVNKGERRNLNILDTTASLSVRTLRSGMMSGITSPARPWFRLGLPDFDLTELGAAKEWLGLSTNRMQTIFLKSNLYNVLPIVYGDLGVFGTAAMYMQEDFNNVVRFQCFPIGSYKIGSSDGFKIDIFYREFQMTVRQLVSEFAQKDEKGKADLSNFSEHVKTMWLNNTTEAWIDVCHMIKPNPDYDPRKTDSKYKKYISQYYEKGVTKYGSSSSLSHNYDDTMLREKGYSFFPVLAPRWEVTGEDYYGTECPGMVAIGDVKQLQKGENRGLQGLEKQIFPSMVGHPSLRNQKTTLLPGDVTFVNETQGVGYRPAHEVRFSLEHLELKQDKVRRRIQRAFYEDLFLMLANSDRRQITAREIEERHEEKLLALGPVLEQLNQDLLDPLIDNTFSIMEEQGLLPPVPPEIAGADIKVEYISIMAQAQKLVGIGSLDRFAQSVANLSSFYPNVLDRIDEKKYLESYADAISVPAGIMKSEEDYQAMQEQKAEAARQQQAMAQAQQMAATAKDLAATKTNEESALGDILQLAQAGAVR